MPPKNEHEGSDSPPSSETFDQWTLEANAKLTHDRRWWYVFVFLSTEPQIYQRFLFPGEPERALKAFNKHVRERFGRGVDRRPIRGIAALLELRTDDEPPVDGKLVQLTWADEERTRLRELLPGTKGPKKCTDKQAEELIQAIRLPIADYVVRLAWDQRQWADEDGRKESSPSVGGAALDTLAGTLDGLADKVTGIGSGALDPRDISALEARWSTSPKLRNELEQGISSAIEMMGPESQKISSLVLGRILPQKCLLANDLLASLAQAAHEAARDRKSVESRFSVYRGAKWLLVARLLWRYEAILGHPAGRSKVSPAVGGAKTGFVPFLSQILQMVTGKKAPEPIKLYDKARELLSAHSQCTESHCDHIIYNLPSNPFCPRS